jgi:hypothetical protein
VNWWIFLGGAVVGATVLRIAQYIVETVLMRRLESFFGVTSVVGDVGVTAIVERDNVTPAGALFGDVLREAGARLISPRSEETERSGDSFDTKILAGRYRVVLQYRLTMTKEAE